MGVQRTIANDFLIRSLESLLSLASSFGHVEHPGVLGVLRESLIEMFLEHLLMPPYQAGTGVIVDSKGTQSGQCDVIIWDDSIFRPLYSARGAGIFLIESVVAVIEVKSTLTKESIRQAIERTNELKGMAILRPPTRQVPVSFWNQEPGILPLSMVFGFRSSTKGSERRRAEKVAQEKKVELHQYLQLVCVPYKPSCMFQETGTKEFPCQDDQPLCEVLIPFAGILNSLKNISEKRGKPNLGSYMVP